MAKKNPGLQLYPAKDFKITIDCVTKEAFESSTDAKEEVETEISESNRRNITSQVVITNTSKNPVQFTEFDRAVLNAALAEIANGNEATTARIIFRRLGGGDKLTPKMHEAILESFEKLASIRIHIISDTASKKKLVNYGDGATRINGYLLPTESVITTINGQTVDAIKFLSQGIIFGNANLRDQIITCPNDLLQAPIKSTPRNIAVNHYLLRRTLSIKGSNELAKTKKRVKPLRKIIRLDDLYEHCGVETDSKLQKQRARSIAAKILDFLVEKEVIKDWKFETKENGKIYSIILEI